jgi:hypothetical protein
MLSFKQLFRSLPSINPQIWKSLVSYIPSSSQFTFASGIDSRSQIQTWFALQYPGKPAHQRITCGSLKVCVPMILYIPHSRILCSTPNVTFQLLALKSLKLLPSFQILQPLATYILGNLKRLPSTSTALPPGLLFSGFFRQTRVVAIVREMFLHHTASDYLPFRQTVALPIHR